MSTIHSVCSQRTSSVSPTSKRNMCVLALKMNVFYEWFHINVTFFFFLKVVSVHPDTKMIQIDEMKLDPGTTYTAMVRTGIHESNKYSGTWSDWSSTVKWNTAYRGEYSVIVIYIFTLSCT